MQKGERIGGWVGIVERVDGGEHQRAHPTLTARG